MTRGRTITATVVGSAEMRAALKHLARNPDIRLTHVVQAVAVGWKRGDGRRAFEAVGRKILEGEITLPGVSHVLAAGKLLIPPGEFRAVQSAARGEFPFGLSRQFLPDPLRIGERISVSDVDDRVVVK